MAKGIGLIGNFRGKVGNMVGYNLKDSNNKQTQDVRVYQPIVKNPKTYGQAEQRAKLAPINATYRALKMIIDRGQEGKAYGNKSRLAWLSAAMKAFNGGWFEKGQDIVVPAWVELTHGSLSSIQVSSVADSMLSLDCSGLTAGTDISTIGKLSTAIRSYIPIVENGDQLTFVGVQTVGGSLFAETISLVIDTTSTENSPANFAVSDDAIDFTFSIRLLGAAVILSREGSNGQHLRSTSSIIKSTTLTEDYTSAEKMEAAIKSYMTAGSNVDWAEESIQG